MDTRDGRIYSDEQYRAMTPSQREHMVPMHVPPTTVQNARGRVGRNDPCPCGSPKKFKHCCLARSRVHA
jgi:uncharacterized protein